MKRVHANRMLKEAGSTAVHDLDTMSR